MDNLTFAFPQSYFRLWDQKVGQTLSQLRIGLGKGGSPSYLLDHFWLIITYFGACNGFLAISCLQTFVTR